MSKADPQYNKQDTGQLPRYQKLNASLKHSDKETQQILVYLLRIIDRKFQDLSTRINILEGATVSITFDKATDNTITFNFKRGVLDSHDKT
jgi:hypothetical protein